MYLVVLNEKAENNVLCLGWSQTEQKWNTAEWVAEVFWIYTKNKQQNFFFNRISNIT